MTKEKLQRIGTLALQVAFVLVFAGLIYSNYSLRQELRRMKSATAKSAQPAFRSGDTLPDIAVRDMNGRSQILAKNLQRETRFVVVDPTCASCEQMINELKQLAAADVVIVSLRPRALSGKLEETVPKGTPLVFVDRMAPPVLQARISGVPRVLRVNPQRTILQICESLRDCGVVSSQLEDAAQNERRAGV